MKRILLYGLLLVAMSVQAQDVLPYSMDTIDGELTGNTFSQPTP